MESKKVKVKLVVGYKQYRVIEVEESEVEKIREVNRMTWRELKQEMRKKESMVKANIVVDSIEDIEEEFENGVLSEVAFHCDDGRYVQQRKRA